MHVLSIQSSVAYGHVGNSSATFPLQRLGVEVSPIITVHFSNHTGYGKWRGPVLTAADLTDVLTGLEDLGVLPTVDAVLSGYVGDVTIGEVVLDAVARVRAANPDALYCCDPVMGDTATGMYVRQGIPEFMRDRALHAADIVTPNHFELEYLVGRPVRTMADALRAAAELRQAGPAAVLITSLRRADADADQIELLAATDDEVWVVTTPRLPLDVDGSGDMTAALFLAHWLRTKDLRRSLEDTANAVYGVLEETHRVGAYEIQLVQAQAAIATPTARFVATRVDSGRAMM
ncbi:MAG: pyridoxal kinase PdxY [Streptosporangiales bacterium]|nr:pyridoxal kinase PdxY [Streptosporangiales bacterium]